ncbi:hypothetical protein L3Y34_002927 [Caenorhabditis briggsae]|nr:hypothetical protein L3Y34_002927 [Caenorhabditis briggsae]
MLKSEDERDVICRSSALKNLDQLDDGRVINIGSWSVQIQEQVATRAQPRHPPALSEPIESQPTSSGILSERNPGKFKAQRPQIPPTAENGVAQMEIEEKPGNLGRKRASLSNPFLGKETPMSLPKRSTFVPPLIDVNATSSAPDGSSNVIQQKIPPFILNEQDILDRKTSSAIIVDPRFARHLRDHQKEGIKFIFDRLKEEMGGAILADDMGLGKSIQTMAATWVLLRGSKTVSQIAQSCLIIVPSSLVNNWKSEFEKWWRLMRFPAVIALTAMDIKSYQTTIKTMPYLVISYDLAQRHVEKLRACRFDVMVCDEGHKLKNLDGRLRKTLLSLEIPRRLILTGTPMQNDFDEFYSILNFVCPAKFDSLPRFRLMCNDDVEQLNEIIDECMLRRTAADVNLTHLPEKHEYILFCAASRIQKAIHSEICDYMTGDPLSLIFFARQLANHPKLLLDNLREKNSKTGEKSLKQAQKHTALLLAFDGPNMPRGAAKESGKLYALADMLKCFRMLQECTVVVSNYIETLDMIEQLCAYLEFRVFRLDGKTQVQDRQKLVRNFNDQRDPSNIFLLSTKAGGVGLNLIGASRLVLFDSDWNPANDQQAMARIWRDGQVRPCHIYRLITTGTIEEKMLQRQIKKTGLGCVIDAIEVGDTVSTFTDEDLKDIFTFTGDDTECNTHDLCDCSCDGTGMLESEMDEETEEENNTVENMDPSFGLPKREDVAGIMPEDDDVDDGDIANMEDFDEKVLKTDDVAKAPKKRNWDSDDEDDDEEVDDEELEEETDSETIGPEIEITLDEEMHKRMVAAIGKGPALPFRKVPGFKCNYISNADKLKAKQPKSIGYNNEEDDDEVVQDSPDVFANLVKEEGENSGKKSRNPKKSAEKGKKKEPSRTIASLAELSRWRHFSPRHPDTWHHFMVNAGLSQVDTDVDLTFAFYQESKF